MNVSAQAVSQSTEDQSFQVPVQIFQPWSTPVLKTTLPPTILASMLEATDELLSDKSSEPMGTNLVGQIENERRIPLEALENIGAKGFLENMVREFVILCKCQEHPFENDLVRRQIWSTSITSCWVVSQYPDEYNPVHFHDQHVSAVMYLKKPKMKPSRKKTQEKDGCICFISPASRDRRLSSSQFFASPEVGDLYLFGAGQMHTVYPYRCYKGEEDTERRSVSFNARFEQLSTSRSK